MDVILFILLLAVYIYFVAAAKNFNTLHKSYLFFHWLMMLWPLCNFLMHITQNTQWQWCFLAIGFGALSLLGFGWLMFSLVLIRKFQGIYSLSTSLWALPAFLSAILAVTNPWHLFARPVQGQWVSRIYGPLFWVFVISNLIYLFASMAYIFRASQKTAEKDLRIQMQLCLTGIFLLVFFVVLDLMINVIFYPVFGIVPGLTSLGIFLSALFFVVAIHRYDLFNVVSIARHEVLDSMATAMIVLDRNNIVLDSNNSVLKYIDLRQGDFFDIEQFMQDTNADGSGDNADKVDTTGKNTTMQKEITIQGKQKYNVSVNVSPVLGPMSKLIGKVITINDVTHLRSLVDQVKRKNIVLRHRNAELLKVRDQLFTANKRLAEMASIDDLTGCYNKRYLLDYLLREISAARRYDHFFVLMILDLDEFKKINDTYGHLAGDDVLRDVAGLIKENLRKSDLVARFGGEEFIIYSPVTDEAGGLLLARRIKEMVESHPFPASCGYVYVTVSIGLVCYSPGNKEEEPPEELMRSLLKRADGALYRAKALGRNRIEVAGSG